MGMGGEGGWTMTDMYARTPSRIIRASDSLTGYERDDLGDRSLLRMLMERDPSLTSEGARGLLTQHRDHNVAPGVC